MKRGKFREFLLIAWMISAIADCLIYLPFLHRKVQLFEIIFCIFFFSSFRSLITYFRGQIPLKWPLMAFAGLALLNSLIHWESQVMLENVGTIYACMIPFVFSHALLTTEVSEEIIEKGVLGGAALLVLSCLIGLVLHYSGLTSKLVMVYQGYPYLDTVVRLTGLTNSPNKVVAFAAVGIYFLLYGNTRLGKKMKILLLSSLLLAAFLTYSKELVIVFFVPVVLYLYQSRKTQILAYLVSLFFIVGIVAMTYFYIGIDQRPPKRQDIVSSEQLADFSRASIYPTSYYFLFRSSLKMVFENPVTGVGFGNYLRLIEEHKKYGFYPWVLDAYEAHDNYAGLIAQYGIGYLAVLVWLVTSLRQIQVQLPLPEGRFVAAVLMFFLLFGFIYFSYHMRLMWMFIGVVIYYAQRTKK